MLFRWRNSSCSMTSIASLASYLFPGFAAALATPGRWLSPSSAAEKNGVWHLWPSASCLLRPTATPGSRSLLWRQTHLSWLSTAPGQLLTVSGREERRLGLAGRQPAVHQAVRFLRGPTVSPNPHPRGSRGTLPRLARRQGAGQA